MADAVGKFLNLLNDKRLEGKIDFKDKQQAATVLAGCVVWESIIKSTE